MTLTGQGVRQRTCLLSVAAVVALLLAGAPASAQGRPDATPDEIVVRLHSGVSPARADTLADRVNGEAENAELPRAYVIEVPDGTAEAAARRLAGDATVEFAEPAHTMRAAVEPNDPCYSSTPDSCGSNSQYALPKVSAPAAWNVSKGSPSVVVAVLDTGVDATHQDLVGKVSDGGNFTNDVAPATVDEEGHGTSVAGVVGALTDNGVGIASLGWNTPIMAVKVLDSTGEGLDTWIGDGIVAAANNGADVINLSLTGPTDGAYLRNAVAYAQNRGVLVVAAAGNEGQTTAMYPAAYSGVLAVAATNSSDGIASFSNRGSWVDMAAPGVGIYTTSIGSPSYRHVSGTSIASPHVAAAAALIMTAKPELSWAAVSSRLTAYADHIPFTGTYWESGRLNVAQSLDAPTLGYWLAATDGGIFPFGDFPFYGSAAATPLNQPVVDIASTTTKRGYWLAATDGGVFPFGSAAFHGSAGNIALNKPVVGMAPTPDNGGYWLVASDGGIFPYGNAAFHGSAGAIPLNKPIVGMAPTSDGGGYWLVASDGGIFPYGNAAFHGSAGAVALNKPIVGMAATPDGGGYWLVASDGGIFPYGNAGFYGSAGSVRLNQPIVGMSATASGAGYWLVAADGGIFVHGDATYLGSTGNLKLNQPIVGMG